ncbi:hypothetical protein Taro_034146 [Colocasia esculenta]|uniref:Uncharacterized protein n=1 Tax=Colocasia esculenta TaxID=4460 RepID=A0A843W6R2_COLES|nr:hypothetical protein [Colocasia esculenta]
MASSRTPTMVTSLVGCPRFSVSQAVSSELCPGTCVVPSSTLLVGGTDTDSRHWSPASPFPVPHSRVLRPETLKVPGMGLQLCVRRSDDSNVTSRVFRILVDPVFSGCDGYREANVVCVWYVCVSQGLIGPIVRACSTLVSSACYHDRKECRVLNVTEVTVALWWPPWGVDRLHVRHV